MPVWFIPGTYVMMRTYVWFIHTTARMMPYDTYVYTSMYVWCVRMYVREFLGHPVIMSNPSVNEVSQHNTLFMSERAHATTLPCVLVGWARSCSFSFFLFPLLFIIFWFFLLFFFFFFFSCTLFFSWWIWFHGWIDGWVLMDFDGWVGGWMDDGLIDSLIDGGMWLVACVNGLMFDWLIDLSLSWPKRHGFAARWF